MNKSSALKLAVLLLSVVLGTASVIQAEHAAGQRPASKPPGSPQTKPSAAAAQPNTLQIFKGMPRPQILAKMSEIAAALGVQCSYCHVNPFEQDTPNKSIARLMLRDYERGMKHKDGTAVSCNDCHKGQPNPLRTLAFEGTVGKKLSGLRVLRQEQVTPVMAAFTQALGVECDYCHTGDFDEETPRKQIARYMMTEFSAKLVKNDGAAVDCNSCHQGHARPLVVLPFPGPPLQPQKKTN